MLDAIALGELLIDFATVDTDRDGYPTLAAHPGGAPGNFLAALHAYGCSGAMLGKVGADTFGDLLCATLAQAGIRTEGIVRDPSVFTTLAFVTFGPGGERAFSFARKPGADTQLRFDELDLSLLDEARLFHFGSLSLTQEPVRSATQQAAAYAAARGDMPAVFSRRWAKNDMPAGAALTSGVVASAVCILGVIIELLSPASSLFWSFFALNLVMLLLSYAPVFPAFLRLREIDPDAERPFRAPGGRGMLRVLAYVPMALILISIFFTAVPLSMDSETLSGYLPITIGSILGIVIGEILIAARARRHS
mgnify:CR=1 FL=1